MSKALTLSRSPGRAGDPPPVRSPTPPDRQDGKVTADLGLGVNTVEEQVGLLLPNRLILVNSPTGGTVKRDVKALRRQAASLQHFSSSS